VCAALNFVIELMPVSYTQAADCRLRGRLADRGRRDGLSCPKHSMKPVGNSVARRLDRLYGRISIPIEQSLPSKALEDRSWQPAGDLSLLDCFPLNERPFPCHRREYFDKDDHTLRSKVAIVSH
jgi:hypothetical protein